MGHLRIQVEAYIDFEFDPTDRPELGPDPSNDEMFDAIVKTAKEERDFDNLVSNVIMNPDARITLKYQLIRESEVSKEAEIE